MKIRKSFMIAIVAAIVAYLIISTYQLASIEQRLGKVEHFLSHQGLEGHHH